MYEEIMRRLENIRIIRSEMPEYEWQAIQEFWEHVESDLRWAMAELAKFHKCDGDGWCTLDGYPLHFKDGERTRSSKTRTVYHKEDD